MKQHPLPHHDPRPAGAEIDTLVVHSLYVEGTYDPVRCIETLDRHGVTSHYLIDRRGTVWRLAPDAARAWHAGKSRMPYADDVREAVNDFSIGIELVTGPHMTYTAKQYRALARLVRRLSSLYPVSSVVGHDHIAPGRKSDPGGTFDWDRLGAAVARPGLRFGATRE